MVKRRPCNAKDFEYAWKWALDPANNSSYSYQLYYLEGGQAFNEGTGTADAVGVKAIDDKTLEVKLVNPTPFFLELTAFYTYLPLTVKLLRQILNGQMMLGKIIQQTDLSN